MGKGTSPTRLDHVICFSSWDISTYDTCLLSWVGDGLRRTGGMWGRPRDEPSQRQPRLPQPALRRMSEKSTVVVCHREVCGCLLRSIIVDVADSYSSCVTLGKLFKLLMPPAPH